MKNNRGSAIALVLLILAAVSLIGVGLIKLTSVDVQFTKAMKSYDEVFNLADGASFMAYKDLNSKDREQQLSFVGQRVRLDNIYQGTEARIGEYSASLILESYGTEPSAGWEVGSRGYYQEYWIGEGRGQQVTRVGRLIIEASTTKSKSKY